MRLCHVCCCLVAQLCPTVGDPMDCSPPASSVHADSPGKDTGVVAMPFSRGYLRSQEERKKARQKHGKSTRIKAEVRLAEIEETAADNKVRAWLWRDGRSQRPRGPPHWAARTVICHTRGRTGLRRRRVVGVDSALHIWVDSEGTSSRKPPWLLAEDGPRAGYCWHSPCTWLFSGAHPCCIVKWPRQVSKARRSDYFCEHKESLTF